MFRLVSLVKGNFREAAKEAKAGFMDIGKGVLGANPVSIGMDIKQRGDWQAAWDKARSAEARAGRPHRIRRTVLAVPASRYRKYRRQPLPRRWIMMP